MGKTYYKEWDGTENRDRETGQDRHRESGMRKRAMESRRVAGKSSLADSICLLPMAPCCTREQQVQG